jgi:PIN domain nuclease of toxin-antitoxin system
MKLLLDTHVWIWSLSEPERLHPRLRDALESPVNERWLSPISVWETLLLVERGRVRIVRDAASLIREALRTSAVVEAPLTNEVAIESRRLLRLHDDPADRFLVATARVLGLTLATQDRRILESGSCEVIGPES